MGSGQHLYEREQPLDEQDKSAGTDDDRLVWQSFKAGSDSAYALMYQRHFLGLYAYGMRLCPDGEIVKDCIQDLFLHIWKNRDKLADVNAIKYYLLQSLKRRLINHLSRTNQHTLAAQYATFTEPGAVVSQEQSLIDEQSTQEQQEAIRRALDKLTVRQKTAIVLKFYQNRRNDEIATAMSISLEAVYNLVYQAIGRLKRNIDNVFLLCFLAELVR